MAERRPLLLAIDDAHWADAASLRALCHIAHRITGLPVLLAVAARRAEPGSDTEQLLQILAAEPGTAVLRPGPLSGTAASVLLQSAFGSSVDGGFAATCQQVSEGTAAAERPGPIPAGGRNRP